ncbi:adenylyl cyclase X E-like [Drosophila rhopaloa]|uniref:Uncharacterized protein n=1 Tax=Drosophila rhopaloa TaxID=1041015 RepID=A0ABM5J9U2_DRORH|nr:adenylyl cyclase X E-like [Drosophila rhopaloa]
MPPFGGKCQLNYTRERMWEPGYLKAKCAELHLEDEFRLYRIRLWKSYLCVFVDGVDGAAWTHPGDGGVRQSSRGV